MVAWESLPDIVRLLLALALVVGLMGGLALAMKKLGLSENAHIKNTNSKKRLKILETLALDSRRRVAIIQQDDQEHLVLLGINGDTVIDTDITKTKSESKQTHDES